jgi:hypothetical protein
MSIEITRFTALDGCLTKRIRKGADGRLVSTSADLMAFDSAERVQIADLSNALDIPHQLKARRSSPGACVAPAFSPSSIPYLRNASAVGRRYRPSLRNAHPAQALLLSDKTERPPESVAGWLRLRRMPRWPCEVAAVQRHVLSLLPVYSLFVSIRQG